MNRSLLMLFVAFSLTLSAALGEEKTEDQDGDKCGKSAPVMRLDEIAKRLGDTPLTEDQKSKVVAVRNEVLKKVAAYRTKDDVRAAMDALAKAKKGNDRNEIRVAAMKLREAMGGYNPMQAFRKGLADILTPEQLAKLQKSCKKSDAKTP